MYGVHACSIVIQYVHVAAVYACVHVGVTGTGVAC